VADPAGSYLWPHRGPERVCRLGVAGLRATYEVVLGPEAIRVIRDLPYPDRRRLGHALRRELADGPNAGCEYRFDYGKAQYFAMPLSFKAYTAVHRPLTRSELARLAREQGRPVCERGFYVVEIRTGVSAFTRQQLS
jgi:hypothetical protein